MFERRHSFKVVNKSEKSSHQDQSGEQKAMSSVKKKKYASAGDARVKQLEVKLKLQQRIIAKLQQQVQQLKAQSSIPETLSEKVLKQMQKSDAPVANSAPSSAPRANAEAKSDGVNDYSQNILFEKINAYLKLKGEAAVSEEGHCHGMTLLWLTMMSWGIESLFYKLVKEIAGCPDESLLGLHETITTFLDYINLGQYPEKHNLSCNDVDKIIGVQRMGHKIDKNLSESELQSEVYKVSEENNMAAISGWHEAEKTNPDTKVKETVSIGHSIGLFFRDNKYCVYDSNYKSGKHKTFSFANQAAAEVRYRLFNAIGATPEDKNRYVINYVTRHLGQAVARD